MRVLALEPFYTGSHRAFLDGWQRHSRNQMTILSLPGRFWKWRMRHAAYTFAEQIADLPPERRQWDIVAATSMLNLAEFRGLAAPEVAALPTVLYFHENQLTYPVREEKERDLHFAFTNLMSVLAADAVWFNSEFHKREFREALTAFVDRMPDFVPKGTLSELDAKSSVQYPGIGFAAATEDNRSPGPLHIVWVSRWEHDKNPELYFQALFDLHDSGIPFVLSVLGESYQQQPEIFETAQRILNKEIVQWGYLDPRTEYEKCLSTADVVVSTANHEFFGIAVVEAILSGCFPLLPNRLSYPELLEEILPRDRRTYFYDGSQTDLVIRLTELASEKQLRGTLAAAVDPVRRAVCRYNWPIRSHHMDRALGDLIRPGEED